MNMENDLNSLIVRVAKRKDMEGLARLNALFNGGTNSAEAIWHRINAPMCVETALVALIGDQVIGFAGLRIVPYIFYEGVHAEVTELFVESGYRRKGVAAELMKAATDMAEVQGAVEVVLQTGADNSVARRFYAAIGFEERDIVPVSYTHLTLPTTSRV